MSLAVTLRTLGWYYLRRLTPGQTKTYLPPGCRSYLTRQNPLLADLHTRYARCACLPHSCWAAWERAIPLKAFRGESVYLSQSYFRDASARYRFTTAYVQAIGRNEWLSLFTEDALFGVKLWKAAPGFTVSRDLLDSIIELSWLQEVCGWTATSAVNVLDLGAGYGRFAHRFVTAFRKGTITCVDPVATSTFLCDFYLRFRECERTTVLPFDELSKLNGKKYDIAINIHSWSETSLEWIRFWLGMLVDLEVPYLFLVPNFPDFRTKEGDGSSLSFESELRRHGFHCVVSQRKYHRSSVVDSYAIFPFDFYLFRRQPTI